MVTSIRDSYGKRAYMAYRQHAGRRSLVTGAELPLWDRLPPEIQDAWCAAATAVLSGITVPDDVPSDDDR